MSNRGAFRTDEFDARIVHQIHLATGVPIKHIEVALHIARSNVPVRVACAQAKIGSTTLQESLIAGNWSMDETIRWRPSQRDSKLYTVTCIVDVTLVPSTWEDPLLWSAKHKCHGWKFQVCVTPQGVPINCQGPYPGRWHDFKCFKPPLSTHTENDVVTADLGYLGAARHVVVPHKTPPRGTLTEEQLRRNSALGKVRARVEHFFSTLKNWALVRDGPKVRNPFFLRPLVYLPILYEHFRMLRTRPRYAISTHDLLPGQPCTCTMKKREREAEGEADE